ncbi:LuxR C-terminal-related transcriptional regulator [Streptomyces griseoviridis]|uniref:LuxR C-terminal-related transcriptional regulator n=1 Tax=Streptomyces griseoviridis TaxID=45398 RepID=UPI003F57BEE8
MVHTPAPRPPPRASRDGRALSTGAEPILSTRFAVPSVPPTFVRRGRLRERLAGGVARPLTLVTGPAGAGKTLCVADWITSTPVPWPTVWLTMEQGDTSPGAFWAYVIEAMRHHGIPTPPGVGNPTRADDIGSLSPARLAAHLNGRAGPVLLVLDEFDRASSREVADQVEFVLRHAGRGLRLVLISRADPLLPLHRWRAADEITEIRAPDLAFRPEETSALLLRHGLNPTNETVRRLAGRTEGWAAGTRLYALAMTRSDDPERCLADFDPGHGSVADFLLAEVLAGQSAEAQELLLRASVLTQVHPGLADALTGGRRAEGILAELERANAFVTTVGRSRYRIHPLFAQALRARLRDRRPGLERELRHTAARWLSEAGHLDDALPQAAAAGDWECAADLFVGSLAVGRLLTDIDPESLDADLARMPPDLPGAAPSLVRAARRLARYDVAAGVVHLRRAEAELRRAEEELRRPQSDVTARLTLALLRVLASRLLGSADMAEAAALTAERLGRLLPAERMAGHPELPALLLSDLGAAQLWAGRLDFARRTLSAAVDLPDLPATAGPRYEALGRIALIDSLRGRYGEAEESARAATLVAERAGLPVGRRSGVVALVLAGIAVERDQLGAARARLRRAGASAGAGGDPVVASGIAILNSRLLLAEGDPRAALRALSEADGRSPTGVRSPWVSERTALAEATADLVGGDPGAALRALDAATARSPECAADRTRCAGDRTKCAPDSPGCAVLSPECAVVAARAHLALGDHASALALLASHPVAPDGGPALVVRAVLARAEVAERLGDTRTARHLAVRALDLARPEQLRRPFLEAGPWLGRALRGSRMPADGWLPAATAVAHRRVGRSDSARPIGQPDPARPTEPGAAARTDAVRAVVVEPLSRRECDVLRQVAQLKSTEEVADDLFLSVNTVKSHLKSIFRKLGASRRGEAVRRAQELDLL